MRVALVGSMASVQEMDRWVISLCYHGLIQALKKTFEYQAFVVVPEKVDEDPWISPDKVTSDLWSKFWAFQDRSYVWNCNADIIFSLVATRSSGNIPDLQKILQDNPTSTLVLLWLDCSPKIEKEFEGLTAHPRVVNFTHWEEQSLPRQRVVDFSFSEDLVTGIELNRKFMFGFIGYMGAHSKNWDHVHWARDYSRDLPSVMIGLPKSDRLPPDRQQLIQNGRIETHPILWGVESIYPLLGQCRFMANSQKPVHRKRGSIVRRIASCAEHGTPIILDERDKSSALFPDFFRCSSYDAFRGTYAFLRQEQIKGLAILQRDFVKEQFSPYKVVELVKTNDVTSDYLSLR